MESVHQQLHNSTQAVDSPVLIGSPLPATNFIQLSSSALVPLGSSPAFGSILSVPVISHPLVSSLQQKQQQQLMQNDSLLLLPASTLSLSAPTNFMFSTSFLNSKIQSTSIDQQLQLNNTQIPVILKQGDTSLHMEHVMNAPQLNQQFVVLPVDGGNRDLAQVSNRDIDNRESSQHKNVSGNTKNLRDRKNKLHGKLIATQLHTDRPELNKPRMKVRNVKSKNTSVTKSDRAMESSVVTYSNCERSKLDLAQIISSIPPGWQVVGVTGPSQMVLGDSMSSFNCPSSISSAFAVKPTTCATEANCEMKCDANLLTNKFPPHDQPGLVSVNLNTSSQPVASETVIDKWPANELTCSVKMDDIPCTHMISIKTESSDSSESNTATVINGQNIGHQTFNHVMPAKSTESHTNSGSVKTDANKQSHGSAVMDAYSVPGNKTVLQELSKIQHSFSSSCTQPVPVDSHWTIIGITSLSPLLPTNTVTTSQAPMPAVELTTNEGESPDAAQRKPSALDTTILKIPLCSSTVSLANKDRNIDVLKRKSTLRSRGNSSVPLANDDGNQLSSVSDMPSLTKPEDIKWTVVGIVGSPLPSSSAINPCISSPSEYLSTSHQVNSARLEDVMSSQLVNILSPLSSVDTGTLLLPAASPPDQLSPSGESRRKSKSQETENKSPKTEAPSSNDDLRIDHSNSPNQWKVVGVTQLGIPLTVANPILPLPQRNPISPVMSMPFLIPTVSGSSFSSYTTENANILTHPTSTAQSPGLLPSLMTSPSVLSSSTLQFPVLNIGGTSCSSALTVPPPTSLLNSASPISMPALQDLAQQQNLSQLIQRQLPACQSMLTLNETSQWNVVGVVANNQVSLLNTNQSNPPVVNSMTPVSKPSAESSPVHATTPATSTPNTKSEQINFSGDGKKGTKGAVAVKNVTIRQSFVSRFEDSNSKRCHLKCKDMMKKHQQESTKIKKNTVSNLLKIKRMQQRTSENGSSEDGDQSIDDYQDISNTSYEVPRKKTKTRSLRSYAGNRKIFTRAQNKTTDERINLRSGAQISILSCKSENDDDGAAHILASSREEKVADTQEPVKEIHDDKSTLVVLEAHSSSRRRKLKVPRKLIADLDYHPFDSSSDSN